jgi:hypothetical protein
MYLIYSFHMPAFVFLAGITAKSNRLAERVLTYFVLLATVLPLMWVWMWAFGLNPDYEFLRPFWYTWFLLSMAWWMITVPFIERFPRTMLVASLVVGLFGGMLPILDTELSAARTMAFWPFFVIGKLYGKQIIEWAGSLAIWQKLGLSFAALGVVGILLPRPGRLQLALRQPQLRSLQSQRSRRCGSATHHRHRRGPHDPGAAVVAEQYEGHACQDRQEQPGRLHSPRLRRPRPAAGPRRQPQCAPRRHRPPHLRRSRGGVDRAAVLVAIRASSALVVVDHHRPAPQTVPVPAAGTRPNTGGFGTGGSGNGASGKGGSSFAPADGGYGHTGDAHARSDDTYGHTGDAYAQPRDAYGYNGAVHAQPNAAYTFPGGAYSEGDGPDRQGFGVQPQGGTGFDQSAGFEPQSGPMGIVSPAAEQAEQYPNPGSHQVPQNNATYETTQEVPAGVAQRAVRYRRLPVYLNTFSDDEN